MIKKISTLIPLLVALIIMMLPSNVVLAGTGISADATGDYNDTNNSNGNHTGKTQNECPEDKTEEECVCKPVEKKGKIQNVKTKSSTTKTTYYISSWKKGFKGETLNVTSDGETLIAGTRFYATLSEYRINTWSCKTTTTIVYEYEEAVGRKTTNYCLKYEYDGDGNELRCEKYKTEIDWDPKTKTCHYSSTNCNADCDVALKKEEKMKPSYKIEIPDPNSTTENKKTIIESTHTNSNAEKNGKNCKITTNIYYEANKTCINAITGKVRYSESCNEDDEYEIPKYKENNQDYWTIFTPLNMKSNEEFVINMIAKDANEKIESKECVSYLQNYLTKTKNDVKEAVKLFLAAFIAADGKTFNNSIAYQTLLKKVTDEGCKRAMSFKIKANQQFYNETKDGKFDGFAFTYRPIDINNPFPNKINKNSYWEGWDGTSPNISESFSKITYATSDLTTTYDRYSLDTPYTDWQELMKPDGSNILIGDEKYENFIERKEKSYYKLGCGPANSTEGSPLYQKECGSS